MAWKGAAFAEAEIYRVVEALGVVAEAEIKADMTVPEAAPATPAGDTLLIGVDGTTSFIDGDWHEVKVGVVGLDVGTGEVPAGQRSIGTVATEVEPAAREPLGQFPHHLRHEVEVGLAGGVLKIERCPWAIRHER